jgi:hypothetical protein
MEKRQRQEGCAEADKGLQQSTKDDKKGQANTSKRLENDGWRGWWSNKRTAAFLPSRARSEAQVQRGSLFPVTTPSFYLIGRAFPIHHHSLSLLYWQLPHYRTHSHNGPTTKRHSLAACCLSQCCPFCQSLFRVGSAPKGARRRCLGSSQHESTRSNWPRRDDDQVLIPSSARPKKRSGPSPCANRQPGRQVHGKG